jgi:TolB-like protein
MIYHFDGYRLDTDTCELRSAVGAIAIEPQVYALLRLLIDNRERLVSKDEIIDRIWQGRAVSEAAVASRVKSARQAIGDDGATQCRIKTVHRMGFRFVAEVRCSGAAVKTPPDTRQDAAIGAACGETSAPSIAVLPFAVVGAPGSHVSIADALPHDLIVELSRLRWLFVIARGSTFRFRGAGADLRRVRDALKVRYCLSGIVETDESRMIVTVELCDTENAAVIWGERYRADISDVHAVRARIAQAVVAALELRIPLNEAGRALRSPENLDAWSAYHLGLHHMYRFTSEGNERAAAFFERAIAREPAFARAYAGLSFTHFENAFLSFSDDRAQAAALAWRWAEAALEHDALDPFCNLVMGRAAWLRGDLEASLPWLDRAVELNPNYAQGQYSRAWTRTLMGQGAPGRTLVNADLELSPLDPLLYGMLGVRAFSHMVMGQSAEAALWAERAARAPRAHVLIEMIAAVAHGMNGDEARARAWVRSASARRPGLAAADFLQAFPFRDPIARGLISRTLGRLDL